MDDEEKSMMVGGDGKVEWLILRGQGVLVTDRQMDGQTKGRTDKLTN